MDKWHGLDPQISKSPKPLLSDESAPTPNGKPMVIARGVAARGGEFWTVFLEASQNGEIALIHQLPSETLHVRCASLLFLFCTAMRNRARRLLG
jgi:hypothetical protein